MHRKVLPVKLEVLECSLSEARVKMRGKDGDRETEQDRSRKTETDTETWRDTQKDSALTTLTTLGHRTMNVLKLQNLPLGNRTPKGQCNSRNYQDFTLRGR